MEEKKDRTEFNLQTRWVLQTAHIPIYCELCSVLFTMNANG